MRFNHISRHWEEGAENNLLSDFNQWFLTHQPAFQARGLTLVFQQERKDLPVLACHLSAVREPYHATISLWETGNCDAEIWDMSDDISLADEERVQWFHYEVTRTEELEGISSDVLERLLMMPDRQSSRDLICEARLPDPQVSGE